MLKVAGKCFVYFQLLTATFIAIIVGVGRTEGHLTLPDSSDACSSTSTSVVIENQIGVPGQVDEVAVSFSNFPCQEYCYENQSCNSFEYQQTLTAAKMLLELREGHQVSQVAVADIVSNCRLLCSQSVKHLKNNVTAVVSTSDSFNHDVQHVLQQEYDPFKNIDTNYCFERFCVDLIGGCIIYMYIDWKLFVCMMCNPSLQYIHVPYSLSYCRKQRRLCSENPTMLTVFWAISTIRCSRQIKKIMCLSSVRSND